MEDKKSRQRVDLEIKLLGFILLRLFLGINKYFFTKPLFFYLPINFSCSYLLSVCLSEEAHLPKIAAPPAK